MVFITAMCIMPSCVKDNFELDKLSDNVQYSGSFALPLAYSDIAFYKVMDLLDTTIELQDNDEGYLSLFYQAYVESKPVQELLNVGNQSFSHTIALNDILSRGTRAETTFRYTTTKNITFDLFNTDAEIDSLKLRSATFDFAVNSSIGTTMRMIVEFPSITKNGRVFKDSVTFMSSDREHHISLPLDGYTVDFTTTSRGFNEIPVNLTVSLAFPESTPPTSGEVSVNVGLNDFRYTHMFGYFGYNELFVQSDTISISIFKDNPKYYMERFYFSDPKLTVRYWNSYGVPSMFYFTEFNTFLKSTGQIWDISSSSPDFPMSQSNPYYVSNATIYGQEALDSIELNKSNSNLDQIVPNRPTWMHFSALAATNPGSQGSDSHNNFITEDSKLRAKIDVEFPLWGYLYNFCYTDTLDIDLSEYTGNYPISRAALLLTLDNAMPAEAFAQFYLVDENFAIIDSLIDNPNSMVLNAAPIDANGKIINHVITQTKVELTIDQIDNLSRTKHMLMQVHVNTDGALEGKQMKIYREYGFKANVGAEVDLNVDGNISSVADEIGSKNLIIE